jgi:hypothetical protein
VPVSQQRPDGSWGPAPTIPFTDTIDWEVSGSTPRTRTARAFWHAEELARVLPGRFFRVRLVLARRRLLAARRAARLPTQERVYGRTVLADPATDMLWLCGLCHDSVHDWLSYLLGEARVPDPPPSLRARTEAERAADWYWTASNAQTG